MGKTNAVRKKIGSFLEENRVYILFLILIIFTHFTAHLFNDDEYFASALDNKTLIDFLRFRYEVWTSRIIIELLLVLLAQVPIVWGVLNIFVFWVLGYTLIQLLSLDKKKDLYGCALVLGSLFLIPPIAYKGAGWIATTLNYLWPCSLALFVLVPVKKILCKEKVKKWEIALSVPALVIAANMELVCAMLFSIMLLSTVIYFMQNKTLNLYFVQQMLLLLLMLVFIFTCPGNRERSASEVLTWFPKFNDLSVFHKLEIGFSSTLYQFIFEPNSLFLCFSLLLFAAVLAKYENMGLRVIASVPLLSSVFLGWLGDAGAGYFPNLVELKYRLTQLGTGFTLTDPNTWMPDLFCLFICAVILFAIGGLFSRKHAFILIYILLTGFATRMAMSFSPTIWISDVRTFWLMLLAIIFCIGALIKLLVHMQYRHKNVVFMIIGCIEALGVLNFWV